MFPLIPILLMVAALISLRILHLDGNRPLDFPWAIGISIVLRTDRCRLRHYCR
ncbi:MAG: hypothetical protein IPN96_23630 [Anaerolineales bacterium]|nr:hypothetical protein [Anaerolineales bacterium]